MAWTCPNCNRPFKHKNQDHSCVRIDADEHFIGKSVVVKEIYDRMMARVSKFGNVIVSPARHAILVTSASTFLAVKPKKEWLDIEFILGRIVTDFPINKTVRTNKTRVAHFVRLESPKDVDKQLIGWLKEAYETVNS